MYIIKNNEAMPIESPSFKDLGLGEVQHLQEWIRTKPDMLGENLLIISREFSGWDKTSERLDLLALDGDGNLVVIENKLDSSGKDVTWQALKYVSYCSTLTREQIVLIFQGYLDKFGTGKNAEDELREFFEDEVYSEIRLNDEQRIILIAADFRTEVTSTVLWLLEREIKIKCVKVTPYTHDGNTFIDIEQIIPVKEVEEYQIKLSEKKHEDKLLQAGLEPGTKKTIEWMHDYDKVWQRIADGAKNTKDLEWKKIVDECVTTKDAHSLLEQAVEYPFSASTPHARKWWSNIAKTAVKLETWKAMTWDDFVESIRNLTFRKKIRSIKPNTLENIEKLRQLCIAGWGNRAKGPTALKKLDEIEKELRASN